MKMLRSLLPIVLLSMAAIPCSAATDAKGCKDSPVVSRFPGSVITGCAEKADDVFEFEMGNGKPRKKVEGKYLQVSYNFPPTASKAQVVRNMNTAMRNAGYTFEYDSGDYGDFTVHLGKMWVFIEIGGGNYRVTAIEETAVTQDVVATAASLSTGLTGAGHVVVRGILFDTGKADIKPESAAALKEVVTLLQQDAGLKLHVVGHTDNVGAPAANLDLSRRRAAAVVEMLTKQYSVAASRLDAFGAGPYAPVASNDSEDGRTSNRRVEIVKQ
jgi:OmpA-OmpF porin, OOP family